MGGGDLRRLSLYRKVHFHAKSKHRRSSGFACRRHITAQIVARKNLPAGSLKAGGKT
jgi:hypothetical protein